MSYIIDPESKLDRDFIARLASAFNVYGSQQSCQSYRNELKTSYSSETKSPEMTRIHSNNFDGRTSPSYESMGTSIESSDSFRSSSKSWNFGKY
jgi:hypothetical protein